MEYMTYSQYGAGKYSQNECANIVVNNKILYRTHKRPQHLVVPLFFRAPSLGFYRYSCLE